MFRMSSKVYVSFQLGGDFIHTLLLVLIGGHQVPKLATEVGIDAFVKLLEVIIKFLLLFFVHNEGFHVLIWLKHC